jgi:hypothetical protein
MFHVRLMLSADYVNFEGLYRMVSTE